MGKVILKKAKKKMILSSGFTTIAIDGVNDVPRPHTASIILWLKNIC